MSTLSKVLLLAQCNGYRRCIARRAVSSFPVVMHCRHYEGKPFDQRDKNWPEQQEKNRHYDIDQNIHNFRKREEERMKQGPQLEKAKQAYLRHRNKILHEMQVSEQWKQHNEEKRAQQNWQDFTFETDLSSSNPTQPPNVNKMAKYGVIGLIGVIGIGFLLVKSQ